MGGTDSSRRQNNRSPFSGHECSRDDLSLLLEKKADIPPAISALKSHDIDLESLPFGLLVGTVDIVETRPCNGDDAIDACVPASYLQNRFAWRLANPVRFEQPLTVRFLPYGVWFYPFKRRGSRKGATDRRKTD